MTEEATPRQGMGKIWIVVLVILVLAVLVLLGGGVEAFDYDTF